MAIVTGLEPGAILWKYSKMEKVYAWNPESRRHEYMDQMRYYTIELYTRRARTNGSYVPEAIYPFLEKLRIRVRRQETWRDGAYENVYHAVGVHTRSHYNVEQWEALQIDETALRYYGRLKNRNMSGILEKRTVFNEAEIIEEMKQAAADFELDTEWPEEPSFSIRNRTASSASW
jgi:hypothetical protein